jgi:hypothetical protein
MPYFKLIHMETLKWIDNNEHHVVLCEKFYDLPLRTYVFSDKQPIEILDLNGVHIEQRHITNASLLKECNLLLTDQSIIRHYYFYK